PLGTTNMRSAPKYSSNRWRRLSPRTITPEEADRALLTYARVGPEALASQFLRLLPLSWTRGLLPSTHASRMKTESFRNPIVDWLIGTSTTSGLARTRAAAYLE